MIWPHMGVPMKLATHRRSSSTKMTPHTYKTWKWWLTNFQMSIGIPSIRMVHFYGHSSWVNRNKCNSSGSRMPSSKVESQIQGMTLLRWLWLQPPQWHKQLLWTLRPPYHTHNLIWSAKAADPKPFDGNQDKTKSSYKPFRSWSPCRQTPSWMREWRPYIHSLSCAEAWHRFWQQRRPWQS